MFMYIFAVKIMFEKSWGYQKCPYPLTYNYGVIRKFVDKYLSWVVLIFCFYNQKI